MAFQPDEGPSIQVRIINVLSPGQSRAGRPNRRVETKERGFLTLSGPKIDALQAGQTVTIAEPKQFGSSSYAFLKHIDELAPEQHQANMQRATDLKDAGLKAVSAAWKVSDTKGEKPVEWRPQLSDSPRRRPDPDPIALSDYCRALHDFHECVAMKLEPDAQSPSPIPGSHEAQFLDRSASRTALVNTFAIALTNGRIKLGE